jgi:hypothetical protein
VVRRNGTNGRKTPQNNRKKPGICQCIAEYPGRFVRRAALHNPLVPTLVALLAVLFGSGVILKWLKGRRERKTARGRIGFYLRRLGQVTAVAKHNPSFPLLGYNEEMSGLYALVTSSEGGYALDNEQEIVCECVADIRQGFVDLESARASPLANNPTITSHAEHALRRICVARLAVGDLRPVNNDHPGPREHKEERERPVAPSHS